MCMTIVHWNKGCSNNPRHYRCTTLIFLGRFPQNINLKLQNSGTLLDIHEQWKHVCYRIWDQLASWSYKMAVGIISIHRRKLHVLLMWWKYESYLTREIDFRVEFLTRSFSLEHTPVNISSWLYYIMVLLLILMVGLIMDSHNYRIMYFICTQLSTMLFHAMP